MALFGFELDEIARLIALVEAQGLDEFSYEEEGHYLLIRGPRLLQTSIAPAQPAPLPAQIQGAGVVVHTIAPAPPPRTGRQQASGSKTSGKPNQKSNQKSNQPIPADQIVLDAPIVGIFYRAEKPGASPLVNVGDRVSVGQVLGVLEAMKVFSEFKAEHAGVITAIPVADGQLVHVGTPLIVLKKS